MTRFWVALLTAALVAGCAATSTTRTILPDGTIVEETRVDHEETAARRALVLELAAIAREMREARHIRDQAGREARRQELHEERALLLEALDRLQEAP